MRGIKVAIGIGGALAVLFVLFGLLFFAQTKDPMILLFAFMASGMVVVVVAVLVLLMLLLRRGANLRCRACGALNPETSRFCGACGQPL